MKHSVLILIAIILTGCASSGSLVVTSRITPSTATVDTASIEAASSIGKVGGGMLIAVDHNDSRSINATLFDGSLNRKWRRAFNVQAGSRLDLGGTHIDGSKLFVPIFERMSSESFGYRLYTLDRVTGMTLDSMTLMRFNQHDLGEFEDHFAGFRVLDRTPSAKAVWSPDSSKLVIFKYYPSSTGRMNMELMLLKRGFILATKTNVDFKFDPNRQNLLSLKLDNDGVAYIFKYDGVDTSFEVARFEVLGVKDLRTIKTKLTRVPEVAKMSIAPRGHAYIAMIDEEPAGRRFTLVDFDFYSGSPRTRDTTLNVTPNVTMDAQPLHIDVIPLEDRIVLSYTSRGDHAQNRVDLLAYNMDILPQWHSSYSKASELLGRHGYYSAPKLVGDHLGHFFAESDTLRFRSVDIRTGKPNTDERLLRLALTEGISPRDLAFALIERKQIYVAASSLFRIVLP